MTNKKGNCKGNYRCNYKYNCNCNCSGCGCGKALFVAEDCLRVYGGGSAGWDPAGDQGYGG